ncbi:MAG: hypothetical protein ACRELB_10585 [Polyangiaceae bacterium]
MTPDALHQQALEIVRQLVQRFGGRLPPDAETTVRYYLGCRAGCDRAARDVLHLRRLAEGR